MAEGSHGLGYDPGHGEAPVQELLGRLAALDPSASLGLRVIACFDELVVGNVNTRGLLSAAASLTGCVAGFRQDHPPRTLRIGPGGEPVAGGGRGVSLSADGLTVWLERTGEPHANDAIVLERLALAVRIRHSRARQGLDNRRDLPTLLDGAAPVDDRRAAAGRLGLAASGTYRVVAAPLFATWGGHPTGPEDVVGTPFGPLHALVVPGGTRLDACPAGIGPAAGVDELHRSFRTAVVALRLCAPPDTPSVDADSYGALIGLLTDLPADAVLPDVDLLDAITAQPWGPATLDALVRAGSVRQAARLGGVHHSTMTTRVEAVAAALGFDPLDGIGRSRLGIAYLVWRLRHSTVLDLPTPGG